jgi:hypothetical protein
MMRRSIALVLVLVLSGSVPAWAADRFQHEGWSGRAVFHKDGKFWQCQMWLNGINNWDLGLALYSSGELKLAVRSRTLDQFWEMLFGQKTALRIQVDQGPVLTKAFTSVTSQLLETSLKNTDWDQRLANGKHFRMNTGSRVRLFHLTSIKEAMGKLRTCVARHRIA